jgi:hypothetical protein
MGWVVVKKTAAEKLNNLKTWDSVFMSENAKLLMGYDALLSLEANSL